MTDRWVDDLDIPVEVTKRGDEQLSDDGGSEQPPEGAPRNRVGGSFLDLAGRFRTRSGVVARHLGPRAGRTYKRDKDGKFSSGGGGGDHAGAGEGIDRLEEIAANAESISVTHGIPSAIMESSHDRDLAAIAEHQGLSGPPKVVTAAEMDAAVADGWTEMYRGTGDALLNRDSAATISERFRTGEYQPGRGYYGNGFYTSVSRGVAEGYRHADLKFDNDHNNAGYSGGAPGGLTRIALSPRARVLEFTPQLGREIGDNPQYSPAARQLLKDPGRYAAARGYDAVRVVNRDDGISLEPPDQYIIINRGAVLVQRAENTL